MSNRLFSATGAVGVVYDLGFIVLTPNGRGKSLRVVIGAAIMEQMGWTAETRLQMLVDDEAGLGQLLAVEKAGRKMEVTSLSGHGRCHFGYTPDEQALVSEYDDVCELNITDVEPELVSLTFELPAVIGGTRKGGK